MNAELPLWEVFVQESAGKPHEHAGSIHATDAEMAMQNARDTYARRGKVKCIWVVPTTAIVATQPEDEGTFFDPARDKAYRHPQFYLLPDGMQTGLKGGE